MNATAGKICSLRHPATVSGPFVFVPVRTTYSGDGAAPHQPRPCGGPDAAADLKTMAANCPKLNTGNGIAGWRTVLLSAEHTVR